VPFRDNHGYLSIDHLFPNHRTCSFSHHSVNAFVRASNVVLVWYGEFARPSKDPRYTEVLVRNPAHDLYHHPHIQGSGREADTSYASFRKGYNIYSLGIVLLEAALWEPVAQTIGLRDENAATSSDTMAVRPKLSPPNGFCSSSSAASSSSMVSW